MEPQPTSRFEWERIVRRVVMPPTQKLVALVLASYADRDGSRVRPGNEVLAAVTGQSERSVKRCLSALRDLGLLVVARRGGGRAGAGKATEYQLTIPVDLLDRVTLLAPGERTDSGAVAVAPQSLRSSVDNPVDNPVDGEVSGATIVAYENDFQGPNDVVIERLRGQITRLRGHSCGLLPTTYTNHIRPTLVLATRRNHRPHARTSRCTTLRSWGRVS
jgi:biotin operon repressor